MERPTLIARTQPSAVAQDYSRVQHTPAAYGIGEGVTALGRGVADLGESAGRTQALLIERQARRDNEAAALRAAKMETAISEFLNREAKELNDPASEAFRAREAGKYADLRRQKLTSFMEASLADYPLTNIQSEQTRSLVQLSEQELSNKMFLEAQEYDNVRGAQLRFDFTKSQISAALARPEPGPFRSRLHQLISKTPKILEVVETSPGIPKDQAKAFFHSQLYEELKRAKIQDRASFLFDSEAQADEVGKQLVAAGADPDVTGLLETARPSSENLAMLQRDVEARLDRAKTSEEITHGLSQYSEALARRVAKGDMGADEAQNKLVGRAIRHVYRNEAFSNMTYSQFKELKRLRDERRVDAATLTDTFRVVIDGKRINIADTSEVRDQFSQLMSEAEELFTLAEPFPQEFAHKVNPRLAEMSGRIAEQVARDPTADLERKQMVLEYNEELAATLDRKGVSTQLNYRPGTGTLFAPPGLGPVLAKEAGKLAEHKGYESQGVAVREVFGRDAAHQAAVSAMKSSDPAERFRGLGFLLAAHGGPAAGNDTVLATIERLATRTGQLGELRKRLESNPDYRRARDLAFSKAQAGAKYSSSNELSAFLSGKEAANIDASQTLQGLSFAVAGKIPGATNQDIESLFTDMILVSMDEQGLPPDVAAMNMAGGLLNLIQDAGLLSFTSSLGRAFAAPNYAQHAPSIFGSDAKAVGTPESVRDSYSKMDEWLGFNIRQNALRRSVFGGIQAIPGDVNASISRLLGNPLRRDMDIHEFDDPMFQEFLFGKTIAELAPEGFGGKFTFGPLTDGSGWAVFTDTTEGRGVFHSGAPSGLYIDTRFPIVPVDKAMTFASLFASDDRTFGGRGWVTQEDLEYARKEYAQSYGKNLVKDILSEADKNAGGVFEAFPVLGAAKTAASVHRILISRALRPFLPEAIEQVLPEESGLVGRLAMKRAMERRYNEIAASNPSE